MMEYNWKKWQAEQQRLTVKAKKKKPASRVLTLVAVVLLATGLGFGGDLLLQRHDEYNKRQDEANRASYEAIEGRMKEYKEYKALEDLEDQQPGKGISK
jgi:uncharacterized protein HemX